jgi:starch phosphorylase
MATKPQPFGIDTTNPLGQYGCGPIQFMAADGLYQRHLQFDNVLDEKNLGPHERFEAAARSVRDVLSQRWELTERTYEKQNPKRAYYISMEFLLGRSLANNITNLLLSSFVANRSKLYNVDLPVLLEQEEDAGLGNGGLGRLAACFLDSMATLQLPAIGYGLRYEYGIFKQFLKNGWQYEQPDNWLRMADPWEVPRPHQKVEIKLNCTFELQGGSLRLVQDRPSTLWGIPFDRPVVGYGGKNINTLRLWAAANPDYFDFQKFSEGDFIAALTGTLAAESITRVLYPDDTTSGQSPAFSAGIFPGGLLARRYHPTLPYR